MISSISDHSLVWSSMPAGQQISLPVVVRGGRWCFGWDRGLCVRPGLWGLKGRQQAVWRGINKQLSSQERSLRGPSSSSCPPGLPPTLLRATCTDNCPQLPGIQLSSIYFILSFSSSTPWTFSSDPSRHLLRRREVHDVRHPVPHTKRWWVQQIQRRWKDWFILYRRMLPLDVALQIHMSIVQCPGCKSRHCSHWWGCRSKKNKITQIFPLILKLIEHVDNLCHFFLVSPPTVV